MMMVVVEQQRQQRREQQYTPIQDHCGIIGVTTTEDCSASPLVFIGLRAIQHRGQESAGIATTSPQTNRIKCIRGMGLTHEVFNPQRLEELEGNFGIGHVRYSTTGATHIKNAQPTVADSILGDIGLAHNGDIINANILRDKLRKRGWAFFTTTDSEVILRLLVSELTSSVGEFQEAVHNLMNTIIGSYSLVILAGSRLLVVRDPFGFKPLCFGRLKDTKGYIVASESVVLDTVNAEFIRDVNPGEIIEFGEHRYRSYQLINNDRHAHCMFEWVYFARPDTVIDGKNVYEVRKRIGKRLAEEQPVNNADVVVPIPDSGRTHAVGFAEALGVPCREGLIKNRYVARTFIMPEQAMREYEVKLKLNPIKSELMGKRVVLVDDSIVRGTTMRRIVQMVRTAGAREVHVRIGSPPIISPCYFGIAMKTRTEFLAKAEEDLRNGNYSRIANKIGADTVGYISIPSLVDCIGLPETELCLGCLTGKYPIELPAELLAA